MSDPYVLKNGVFILKGGKAGSGVPLESHVIPHGNTSVGAELDELNQNLTKFSAELTTLISGTIPANATSTVISDERIHTTSIIDVYFADAVPSVTSISVAEGSCTISITKRNAATGVSIRVLNGGV